MSVGVTASRSGPLFVSLIHAESAATRPPAHRPLAPGISVRSGLRSGLLLRLRGFGLRTSPVLLAVAMTAGDGEAAAGVEALCGVRPYRNARAASNCSLGASAK